MSIYVVNLTEFNDRTLKSAMNEVSENSLILFEDIDCMRAGNRREDANPSRESKLAVGNKERTNALPAVAVTLLGLLNVLDGFHAPDNVVYVMTANHVEALDPALLRPGRIDYKVFMGEAAESQKVELYRRFFPESTETEGREFAQAHGAETMAEFQGLLLALELDWQSLEAVSAAEKCVSFTGYGGIEPSLQQRGLGSTSF